MASGQFFTDDGGVVRPIRAGLGSAYRTSIEKGRGKLVRGLSGPRGPLRALPSPSPRASVRERVGQLRTEGERLSRKSEEALASSLEGSGSLASTYGIFSIPPEDVSRWRRIWAKRGSEVRPKAKLNKDDTARLWLAWQAEHPDAHSGDDWYRDMSPDVYERAMHDTEIARSARGFITRGSTDAKRMASRARALLTGADRAERTLDPAGRLKRIERELEALWEKREGGDDVDESHERQLLDEHTRLHAGVKRSARGRPLQRVTNPSAGALGWGVLGAIAVAAGLVEWALRRR